MKFAMLLRMLPESLKPVVTRILSNLPSQVQQAMEFLKPLFEERTAKLGDLSQGDWDDRPVRRFISRVYLPCYSN